MNGSFLKAQNSQNVFKEIIKGESCSRISIAKKLGLSKMTVTNIVSELIEKNLVIEKKVLTGDFKGRPAIELMLSPNAPKAIGIYISPSYFCVLLEDLKLNVVKEKRIEINKENQNNFEDLLLEILDEIVRSSLSEKFIGIGISIEGKFNKENGVIEDKNIYFGRDNIDIKSKIKSHYDLPIYFDKSDICGVLAEARFGSGKGIDELLYLDISKKVFSAAIHEGKIIKLDNGDSFNLAHFCIDYNGLSCSCGNKGCLEAYINSEVMGKKLKDITKIHLDFAGFCELQNKKNDARIDWALKDMMDKLSIGLTSYISLMHPKLILIGGDGYFIPNRYLSKLEKSLNEKTSDFNKTKIQIAKPSFKSEAKEIGSIISLIDNII